MNRIDQNQRGVAILMVMASIALLAFLLADFTFETKLNKLKVYNAQDKLQARMNAEAGLRFAMAKLRLYKEGRNKLEKDQSLKSYFPPDELENIITQPFAFPIPASSKMNVIQKSAIDEFAKNSLIRGEMFVTISKESGFLNPNHLIGKVVPKDDNPPDSADGKDEGDQKVNSPPDQIIEERMIESLKELITSEKENNQTFYNKHSGIDPVLLIKELRYYVNPKGKNPGPMDQDIASIYSKAGIEPKFAPMHSIDEMYNLAGWDDDIIDLFKDKLSTHEVSVIPVNEITSSQLKVLFPSITSQQIEEFFKYRDGDPEKKIEPKKFKSADEFKQAITGQLGIVGQDEYDRRIKEFESVGIFIDVAGKMYKVTSKGSFNNAKYTIVAYVDLPIKPQPKKKKPKAKKTNPNPNDDQAQNPDDAQGPDSPGVKDPAEDSKKDKKPPLELLNPRVIEVRLE